MSERNIKLVIEYRGTAFHGWQVQPGQSTIQGEITDAIFRTTQQATTVAGAGRTDAGVHALAQVANFRIDHDLPAERYRDALNYHLPDDIRVKSSEEVPPDFHARFSARSRRYRYLLAGERSAIYRDLRWELETVLDRRMLDRAAAEIVGEHDFCAFCTVASRKEDNRCAVAHSRWRSVGPLLVYEIRANRFLHSMVRSLVGAMVNLAVTDPDRNAENLTWETYIDMLRAPTGNRNRFTAPAQGLYLVAVGY